MREVPVSKGSAVALVDDEDYDLVAPYKWYLKRESKSDTRYAVASARCNGKHVSLSMHRLLLSPIPAGMVVDHRDRNGLNNVRANLRLATKRQNTLNRRSTGGKGHGYRGVAPYGAKKDKWMMSINDAGTRICVVGFPTPESAARAYDYLARRRFGEFATLNFPDHTPRYHN